MSAMPSMVDECHEPRSPIPDSDEELLAECRVETFRAGGPGGQHQNTTESGVRLVHLPTGVRVVARDERSQHRNRSLALERLRERLERREPTRAAPGAHQGSARARSEAARERSGGAARPSGGAGRPIRTVTESAPGRSPFRSDAGA